MTYREQIEIMRKILLFRVWPIALLGSPLIVHAAELDFERSFMLITLSSWLGVLFLSALAGVTALLLRISAAMERDESVNVKIKHIRLFAAAQMAGSILSGVTVFMVALHNSFAPYLTCAAIILASFGGAKTLEMLAEKFFNKVKF